MENEKASKPSNKEKENISLDRKSIFMNLPVELLDEIDKYCSYKFTNRTQFIISAVLEKLEKEGFRNPNVW